MIVFLKKKMDLLIVLWLVLLLLFFGRTIYHQLFNPPATAALAVTPPPAATPMNATPSRGLAVATPTGLAPNPAVTVQPIITPIPRLPAATATPNYRPLHIYYVAPDGDDAATGQETAPFGTIQHALDLSVPGDLIYVREGVYHEAISIDNAGTVDRPIRLLAYPGEAPVLDGEYTLPGGKPAACNNEVDPPRCFVYNPLVRIRASHVEVNGFEVMRSAGRGIGVAGSETARLQNVQIRNCSVHDVRNSTVHVQYTDDVVVEYCDIYHTSDYATYSRAADTLNWPAALVASRSHRVLFQNNTVHENWGAGISADVDSTVVVIRDNIIYDNYAAHIYVHRAQAVTVARNFIYNTNQPDFRRGGDPHDCLVFNNEEEFMDSQTVKDVEVINNVIVGCGMNIALRGSEGTGLPIADVRIMYNTLVNAQSNLLSTEPYGLNVMGNATVINVLFAHNIIQQDTGIIATARPEAGITYHDNLWSRQPPPHMLGEGDIVTDPQLTNPDARRVPGQVLIEWYKPRKSSQALLHTIGPFDYLPLDEVGKQSNTPNLPVVASERTEGQSPLLKATAFELAAVPPRPQIVVNPARVSDGLAALYTFDEGAGTTVYDLSNIAEALDLTIRDTTAVRWLTGALRVEAPTVITSNGAAHKINRACRTNGEITVEAWIRSADLTQQGPARIVALAADVYNANFVLGQGLWGNRPSDLYEIRLRTTESSDNGQPSLATPVGSVVDDVQQVVYTRNHAGEAALYLNGVLTQTQTVPGTLIAWNRTYALALANELDETRPWLGEYHLVAIYCQALDAAQVTQNFQAG